jgi:hypothetical protein
VCVESLKIILCFSCLLKKKHNEELAKCCESLFDILDSFADNKKGRAAVWPFQIMLLVLSPVSIILYLFNYLCVLSGF